MAPEKISSKLTGSPCINNVFELNLIEYLTTDEQVTLTEMNLTDAGVYVCEAANPGGMNKKIFFVTVLCR